MVRDEYPTRPDLSPLQEEPVGEAEHPMVYYQRVKRKWQAKTDRGPGIDPLHTSMFRKVLIDGLAHPIRSRLEYVVGLAYKPEAKFCEYMAHAIKEYRMEEQRKQEQEKDILKKVAQLQLSELTKGLKSKMNVQAPMLEAYKEQEKSLATSSNAGTCAGPAPCQATTGGQHPDAGLCPRC